MDDKAGMCKQIVKDFEVKRKKRSLGILEYVGCCLLYFFILSCSIVICPFTV